MRLMADPELREAVLSLAQALGKGKDIRPGHKLGRWLVNVTAIEW